jgi:hypothetical protein
MEYKFDKQGGFFVHDAELRLIDYAYPSSSYAVAARKNPKNTADAMLIEAVKSHTYYVGQTWSNERYGRMIEQFKTA